MEYKYGNSFLGRTTAFHQFFQGEQTTKTNQLCQILTSASTDKSSDLNRESKSYKGGVSCLDGAKRMLLCGFTAGELGVFSSKAKRWITFSKVSSIGPVDSLQLIDSNYVLTAGSDGLAALSFYDEATNSILRLATYQHQRGNIRANRTVARKFIFHSRFVSGGGDGVIRLWDMEKECVIAVSSFILFYFDGFLLIYATLFFLFAYCLLFAKSLIYHYRSTFYFHVHVLHTHNTTENGSRCVDITATLCRWTHTALLSSAADRTAKCVCGTHAQHASTPLSGHIAAQQSM